MSDIEFAGTPMLANVRFHRAEAEKIAGGRIAVRVLALFVIDEGKIVLCDELTRLEHGAGEVRDLASRQP